MHACDNPTKPGSTRRARTSWIPLAARLGKLARRNWWKLVLPLRGGWLKHAQWRREAKTLARSGLFDSNWYLGRYPDVAAAGAHPIWHYLLFGAAEGRDPHPLFDSDWYLARNPDVAAAGVNPLVHYLSFGAAEGRDPHSLFDSDWYLQQNTDRATATNPLAHYIRAGAAEGLDPNPLFDSDWYREENPDTGQYLSPLHHYLSRGINAGRPPHPHFANIRIPVGTAIPSALHSCVFTSPVLCRVSPALYLRRFQKSENTARDYTGMDDFLRIAQIQPRQIDVNLCEADLRIISVMEELKQRLAAKYAGRAQSELVTVIMPTRNREKIIPDAIASVLLQSYTNWQIVIVDDASSDNTEAVVADVADDRILYLRLHVHAGSAAARNAGLSHARGSVIAYLDDDDQWDPDYLLISLNMMREQRKRMLYSAQIVWSGFDPVSKLGHGFNFLLFAPFERNSLESGNYISMIACIHDRTLIEECGAFDETLAGAVDWDLFLRFTEVESPAALTCILSHYFVGRTPDSVSQGVNSEASFRKVRDRLLSAQRGGVLRC